MVLHTWVVKEGRRKMGSSRSSLEFETSLGHMRPCLKKKRKQRMEVGKNKKRGGKEGKAENREGGKKKKKKEFMPLPFSSTGDQTQELVHVRQVFHH